MFRTDFERAWTVRYEPDPAGGAVGDRFRMPVLREGVQAELVAKRFDKLLVDFYGVRQSMASIRHIDIRANLLYPEITPMREPKRRPTVVPARPTRREVLAPKSMRLRISLPN